MVNTRAQLDEGQKTWGRGIDAQSDGIDTEDIDNFIKFKILEYEDYDFKDDDLWDAYKDDFESFTLETFKECSQNNIRKLRALLRTRGVWVKKHRNTTVPESLFNTLQEEEPEKWTESEIREHMATGGEFNSGRIRYMLNHNFPRLTRPTTPIITQQSTSVAPQDSRQSATPTPQDPQQSATPTPIQGIPYSASAAEQNLQDNIRDLEEHHQNPGFGRELTNLAKK
jgi:hypothetical protein